MSKIQWEYDLVEKPFCQQLKATGWEWIEGDTDDGCVSTPAGSVDTS